MQKLCILVVLGVFSTTTALHAASTIILGDGGDLVAEVAAAQHGDVIELRSNGPFVVGNLSWEDKYLTIQAGAGFQPVIQGGIGGIDGNSQTGGTFRGLTITGNSGIGSTGTTFTTYRFEDSTLQGDITIGGTGRFQADIVALDSEFQGGLILAGTGGFNLDAMFERNVFSSHLLMSTTGNETVHDIDFVANDFLIRPQTQAGGNLSHRNLTFSRNRLRNGIDIAFGSFNNLDVRLRDNMLGSTTDPNDIPLPGILLRSLDSGISANLRGDFVNNTVVGFDVGIERRFDAVGLLNLNFTNMLLENRDDLLNVPANDVSYSLISDGTYDGQNNNFSGTPMLGFDGRLLAGSMGIDRGNNGPASTIDILGRPRIVDGNGDGVPVVDVGAHEFVIPEPTPLVLCVGLAALTVARRSTSLAHRQKGRRGPAPGCRSAANRQ
jgi:hypothetical protein